MTRIGFSTGALAYADFREGLRMSHGKGLDAIELSALRAAQAEPLVDAIPSLNLAQYSYVSFHAPSRYSDAEQEGRIARLILDGLPPEWPVIAHPDASADLGIWNAFGSRLLIENMDKRKPGAQTAKDLGEVYRKLPDAGFCFDIGHARQVDPTMIEARLLLQAFPDKLREIHISEVNTASRHAKLSYGVHLAFQKIADLIPPNVAVILETPIEEESEMLHQAEMALDALGLEASSALRVA